MMQAGTIFDDFYEIVGRLGQGTTGTVYEARHTRLDRRVALKLSGLSPEAERPARREQFLQECQALACLTAHPDCGIPRLHVVTEIRAGQLYHARELVEGSSLEQAATTGLMTMRAGLSVIAEVARVVQRVHDHGFVHRNLSAANVLVAQDGTPWLIGFGRVGLLTSTPAEVDIHGLQQLLQWLCVAIGQPVPASLERAVVSRAVPTAQAFAEALHA
jgi:serine/threonine protein kinase